MVLGISSDTTTLFGRGVGVCIIIDGEGVGLFVGAGWQESV
jgi:hypothetical protein